MPRHVPIPTDFGYRPFTLTDAKQLGLGVAFIRGSRFRRVFRGVFIRADVEDTPRLRFDAAAHLTRHPIWATCHTAAAILRAPVPEHPLTHIGLPPGCLSPERVGLASHCHDAQPPTHRVAGRRVATAEDTFLQLAHYLDLVDLVIVGDALVRLGHTSPAALVVAATTVTARSVRLARRAALLVRERVDSPMETRLRLLIVFAGLPEPTVNKDAVDEGGGWIARPDLSYPRRRIALEYDGALHLRKRQRTKDIRRRELYDAAGWRVLVITDTDFYHYPAQTLVRVWMVLQERRHPDVPTMLREDWRPYFDPRLRRVGDNSPSARG